MDELFAPPSLVDPRVMLMVPRGERAALAALWKLEARLFAVVAERREVMLAQIKLAWWRERLGQVAGDSVALPRGEPLLAELAQHWSGRPSLAPLADAYEAIMVAQDARALAVAGATLATAMACGPAWGLVRAAQLAGDSDAQAALWKAVLATTISDGPRFARTLDRWARLLAKHGGAVSPRAEGWLLLRAGIGL